LTPDLKFSDAEIQVWDTILDQLKLEIPIQYLLGKTSFYGLEFQVNEAVLIDKKRKSWSIGLYLLLNQRKQSFATILDIGTGSGCIAISLAKTLKTHFFALDVSEEALATAKKKCNCK
jgi:release factor glutamine methyltransferase